MKLNIIFENEHFVVINKPAGLLSIPDREGKEISLKKLLAEQYGKENIFTIHRLDKDTSGVIVFAKDAQTHKELSGIFEDHTVEKFYVGLVHGSLENKKGIIDVPIMEQPGKANKMMVHKKGKPSLTDYEVIEDFKIYSWMQFQIHTGRTHQIRVHSQYIDHPIVCDEVYGSPDPVFISSLKRRYNLSKNEEAERAILSRLALHSQLLRFELNGETFSFEAELPKDLRATLQQMKKHLASKQKTT